MRTKVYWCLILLSISGNFGCSDSGTSAIDPCIPIDDNSVASYPPLGNRPQEGNHYLWGYWEVDISADHTRAEIIPVRTAEMHLNTVRLLEVGPCDNCLSIENLMPFPPNEVEIDIRLKHPFLGNNKYCGFDVRGIFITNSDYLFPTCGKSIAWDEPSPRLLNPDGHTALFNPVEFPIDLPVPPALKYIPGNFASDGEFDATLNPFLAYRREFTRRVFNASTIETRTARIRLPDGPVQFGYAVDASWFPVTGPVTDPVTDFPPQANSLEAYQIECELKLLNYPGISSPMDVIVYDHQGTNTIINASLEAPDLFSGIISLTSPSQIDSNTNKYTEFVTNELCTTPGEYPMLVRVRDSELDPNLGAVDGWAVIPVEVSECKGWALTWGGDNPDDAYVCAVDSNDNIIVSGVFESPTVDLDPGPGIDEVQKLGGPVAKDVFVSKFSSGGQYIWGYSWSTESNDKARCLCLDQSDNAYLVRHSEGTDTIAKIDPDGNFLLTLEWDNLGTGKIETNSIVPSGSEAIFLVGGFKGTVDFDPGPGSAIKTSSGAEDAFLCRLTSDGALEWVLTWGAEAEERAYDLEIDSTGLISVIGTFASIEVDFNAGPDVDNRNVNGEKDVFVSRYYADGTYHSTRTWGGSGNESADEIVIDPNSDFYVSGSFDDTVDFDPGPGIKEVTPIEHDVYLSKFSSDGKFQWVDTWDTTWSFMTVDQTGSIYLSGTFDDTVDFDPGPGVEERTSVTFWGDCFVCKLNPDGSLVWVRTWGGLNFDRSYGISIDSLGNIYIPGGFDFNINLAPPPWTLYKESNGMTDAFLIKLAPDGTW